MSRFDEYIRKQRENGEKAQADARSNIRIARRIQRNVERFGANGTHTGRVRIQDPDNLLQGVLEIDRQLADDPAGQNLSDALRAITDYSPSMLEQKAQACSSANRKHFENFVFKRLEEFGSDLVDRAVSEDTYEQFLRPVPEIVESLRLIYETRTGRVAPTYDKPRLREAL